MDLSLKTRTAPSVARHDHDHDHDHDHGPGHPHVAELAAVLPIAGRAPRAARARLKRSLFLASVFDRLAVAVLLSGLLWLAVLWAAA